MGEANSDPGGGIGRMDKNSIINLKPGKKPVEILVSFESGHYKKVKGTWKGDSVWCHFNKENGGQVHVNKDKVEYMETFE
jgi:hypothetical protein